MAKKFIQKAVQNPGSLTRKAKAKGQTVSEYCSSSGKKSTQTKRQCNLAKTLNKVRPKKSKKK